MDKNQKNQIKLASFSILGLCFVALMVFLNQNQKLSPEKDLQVKALQRMDVYAQRLIQNKFMEAERGSQNVKRGLASTKGTREKLEGKVGLDPWGHPFHYFVKKDESDSKQGLLVVWSQGQDESLETTPEMVHSAKVPSFKGDDFGTTINFSL